MSGKASCFLLPGLLLLLLLMEVDVMWSSAAGVALLKQMKPALRGPRLLPAGRLYRWMEG